MLTIVQRHRVRSEPIGADAMFLENPSAAFLDRVPAGARSAALNDFADLPIAKSRQSRAD